ncbi:MAG: 2-oxo acid dehydrogenase subunit E2 [Anaerolineae bacterium]|nr:MAG: 2-oxo acid dehydrogenase subunit E2 [Anaerolineae bacterium]
MATKVLVPRLGEGVEEVTITKWLKKEGESVRELEPLLEVNTDKVDTEIPSPTSGTVLKIEAQEGETVPVGRILAWIGEPGEEPGEAPEAPSVSAPAPEPVPVARASSPPQAESPSRDLGFISPVVARLAAEHGIDLRQVKGTGLRGRITKKDVLRYLEKAAATPAPPPPEHLTPDTKTPSHLTPATETPDTLLPHPLIRRQIAEHMVHSKRTIPHVLTVFEVDMSRVVAHREANKEAFARDDIRLTYTAYFLVAAAQALRAYPRVNSTWTDEGLILHREINIGVAVSLGEEGLIVPVIKNADRLSLLGIARAVNDLAQRARSKQLRPDEVQGGTFTLTNHGVSGSLFAFPVIPQGQCGILGVGALQKRPVVVADAAGSDALAIRPMVYLSFVFDHRILDGALADRFLAKVKEVLEGWER